MDKGNYDQLINELSEGCCCCRAFNKLFCKRCCMPCCRKGCKVRCACCWPESDKVAQDPRGEQRVNLNPRMEEERTNNN